jgi:hypothetical protein
VYVYLFSYLSPHLKLGVLGPWEFLWRAGSCIYSVCVTPLCGVSGRYNFICALLGADVGTVQIFPFLWLCCSGYGIVEMTRGVVRVFFFYFPQSAVSSFGDRMSAVGFLCYII